MIRDNEALTQVYLKGTRVTQQWRIENGSQRQKNKETLRPSAKF